MVIGWLMEENEGREGREAFPPFCSSMGLTPTSGIVESAFDSIGGFGTNSAPPSPGLIFTLLLSLTRIPGGNLKTGTFGVGIADSGDGSAVDTPGGAGRARGSELFEKSESALGLPPIPPLVPSTFPLLLLRSISL